jgi:6-pyruvoyltetrahydropterin/6-carboxytetrahydropterin synthase
MFKDTVRVTKVFTFDMAHALFGYDGPCKNIHGHTYHLHVTLSGKINQQANDPEQGLVIDFGVIKQITKDKVISKFDHALVLHKDAPYSIDGFLNEHFEKIILLNFQPSCENLMMHFRDLITSELPKEVKLVKLRLEETPTSYAEWFKEDQI